MPASRLYAAAQAQAAGLQGELARAHAQVAELLRAREAAYAREGALQLQVSSTRLCRGHGASLPDHREVDMRGTVPRASGS